MRRRMFSSLGALSWLLRQLGRVGSWPRVALRARSPLTSSVDSLWTARRLGNVARPQPPHRGLGKPCGFTTSGLGNRLGRFPYGWALGAAVGSLGAVGFWDSTCAGACSWLRGARGVRWCKLELALASRVDSISSPG